MRLIGSERRKRRNEVNRDENRTAAKTQHQSPAQSHTNKALQAGFKNSKGCMVPWRGRKKEGWCYIAHGVERGGPDFDSVENQKLVESPATAPGIGTAFIVRQGTADRTRSVSCGEIKAVLLTPTNLHLISHVCTV